MSSNLSACKSCGAAILWATTPSGKRIPLDPDPDPGGIVALGASGIAVFDGLPDERPRYRPHWATCPQADQWRRRRK